MKGAKLDKYCTLLFLRDGDQVLLAMKKRGFGAGYWNGIGGKIDPGETLEQALVRECQEEIDVTPTSWTKVAEHNFIMNAESDEAWHMFVHTFIATEWQGEPTESEEMAPEWFHDAKIPFDSMWQDDPYWIPQVMAGKKITGTFTFDESNNLLTYDTTEVEELPGVIPTARV